MIYWYVWLRALSHLLCLVQSLFRLVKSYFANVKGTLDNACPKYTKFGPTTKCPDQTESLLKKKCFSMSQSLHIIEGVRYHRRTEKKCKNCCCGTLEFGQSGQLKTSFKRKIRKDEHNYYILELYFCNFCASGLTLSWQRAADPEAEQLEHRRRWEEGQIDYLGRDAFKNIQKMLDSFLD